MSKFEPPAQELFRPSPSSPALIFGAARLGAITGAVTGLGVALAEGFRIVRRSDASRAEVAAYGLTEVGTGAMLGVIGSLAAAATGAGVAAVLGRSAVSMVASTLAGTLAATASREPAYRTSRRVADRIVGHFSARGRPAAPRRLTIQTPKAGR
jgi:hypothetical protein